MKEILYVTGNPLKVRVAQEICASHGISFTSASPDISEIQADTGEPVARDKAQNAYDILQRPLVVSDDNWSIPALNGFPGPYAKYINEWFSADDWIRLTDGLEDRRIILSPIVVYQDQHGQQLFRTDVIGTMLHASRGESPFSHMTLTSFDGGQHSVAEIVAQGKSAVFEADKRTSWHDFAEWYTSNHAD